MLPRSPYKQTLALAAAVTTMLAAAGCGKSAPPRAAATVPSPEAFSKCMRSHGVPLFPDSRADGKSSPGSGVDPNSPQFQRAQAACRSLLPAGANQMHTGGGSPLTPAQLAQMLRYARCMRAHGVPRFPDPTSHGIAIDAGVDPRSPHFAAAQTACRSLLPNLGKGETHVARP